MITLTDDETKRLELIFQDLALLFMLHEIRFDELDSILAKLKTEEARSYLKSLAGGSKPETVLRESFLAGNSILGKYLFGEKSPEVRAEKLGFIDYVVGEPARFILVELKSLYERTPESIEQTVLKPEQHKEQILKYFDTDARYVVLTNLKEWFFFNHLVTPRNFEPFATITFEEFQKDFAMKPELWNLLERKEQSVEAKDLDKKFFASLKSWVDILGQVEFTVDDKKKIELIISLINKFIFVQTLDAYWVIEYRFIKKSWDEVVRKWAPKGKLTVLQKFFGDVDEWFYSYYDTELFRTNILDYVKLEDKNIEVLVEKIELVLGLAYWQSIFEGGFVGIMQYNFKLINEDIFGKAYETFLAKVRHDEGIFYTPSYITQYIVDNTVGLVFDSVLAELRIAADKEDLDRTKELASQFVSIRILDPACGSGSFLVKAVRVIWRKYGVLNVIIESLRKKIEERYTRYGSNELHLMVTRLNEMQMEIGKISEVQRIIGYTNQRELVSRILVRHIHANDLDSKALDVAKVDLWLEAVKLAPTEFDIKRLPQKTNRILPDLEMNFGRGDSVVGLPFDRAIQLMSSTHAHELKEMSRLREEYLGDPTKSDLVEKISEVKDKVRRTLDTEFESFLKEQKLPKEAGDAIKPFHWPLEFWFLYFDLDGKYLGLESSGVHVIVGNPPYERIQVLRKKSPYYVDYLDKFGFRAVRKGNYDLAVIFIERGYSLLRRDGRFGYIVTNKFIHADYGQGLRNHLSNEKACYQLISFGDQQVFDDATTYTALLFLKKHRSDEVRYALISRLERTIDQLERVSDNRTFKDQTIAVLTVPGEQLTDEPWSFAVRAEQDILDKLSKFPKLGDVKVASVFVGIQTSADKVFILDYIRDVPGGKELISRADGKPHSFEEGLLHPLLSGIDVRRYEAVPRRQFLIFPYHVKNDKAEPIPIEDIKNRYPQTHRYLVQHKKTLEDREEGRMVGPKWYGYVYPKNMTIQGTRKLCVPRLATRIRCYFDEAGEYYLDNVDVGGLHLRGKTSDANYWYVCALLNSALLTFYLRKKYASSFRGGFVSCNKQYLSRLPIKSASGGILGRIKDAAFEIARSKLKRTEGRKRWGEIAADLKDGRRTLTSVLDTDRDNSREGKFEDCWTKSVTFYPHGADAKQFLDIPYVDLMLEGGENTLDLTILGTDEAGKETEVYKASFLDRNQLLHMYYCMSSVLESHVRVTSLRDLFDKTEVPLIQLNPRLTTNIISKLHAELGDGSDIVRLDNRISNLEAAIDAIVFKHYELTGNDARIVLESLGFSVGYTAKVLRSFA